MKKISDLFCFKAGCWDVVLQKEVIFGMMTDFKIKASDETLRFCLFEFDLTLRLMANASDQS